MHSVHTSWLQESLEPGVCNKEPSSDRNATKLVANWIASLPKQLHLHSLKLLQKTSGYSALCPLTGISTAQKMTCANN